MNKKNTLDKEKSLYIAYSLYKKGRYHRTLKVLSDNSYYIKNKKEYPFLMGFAHLQIREFAQALPFLKRAKELNPVDARIDHVMAICALGLKQEDKALKVWLKLLDDNPRNTYAQQGLNILKKYADSDALDSFINSVDFDKMLPKLKLNLYFYIPKLNFNSFITFAKFIIISFIVLGVLSSFVLFIKNSSLFNFDFNFLKITSPLREGYEKLTLEKGSSLIDKNINYQNKFHLNENNIKESYEKIKKYFNEHKDNLVQKEINLIEYSNANQEIKSKTKSLEQLLIKPTFADFTNSFTFDQIKAEPLLHNKTYIKWIGRVSNLEAFSNLLRFDFIIENPQNPRSIEGIIPCELSFALNYHLQNGMKIEVLAQVITQADDSFILNIEQIYLLEK